MLHNNANSVTNVYTQCGLSVNIYKCFDKVMQKSEMLAKYIG